ncbi:ankyrin repeat domain-containing protein 13D-like [Eriocheir sinensis]|uniref:ankyrin repeat domain-containing protein 13D-like n=1 Tax=Eriocheir sinensis TaxID=95602 RepID=UPI0021C80F3F|nr:ankyrin repeat domain-containing protein 13D-like [Eriocheir sinensis]XP_050688973.1 ankyrin repeat domain-containing protein 13D-like [Eriocheir sinensis]XP_050688974.1 ankyrin repeat domain-containing protein 13D-like [Eriocheir sinensis]XP_050688975.1 ankyrin repeat domain-containing protein 13D-like [Eriocheir sinensis]XP_050688977.1 ankyrin repeat domain-containing protein 13D-like [Eriocheir sinensis]
MNDYGSAESNTASDTSPSNGDLKLEGANSLQENEINGERNNTKVEHEEVEKKGGPDVYPLHYLVWHNNYRKLEKELTENKHNKELRDPRGRTPLMLAVTLGHLESSRVLLRHHCNVNVESSDGWTVLQEATATGDPELLGVVLEGRDMQRYSSRIAGIPTLLSKLKEAPDFYVEMKWEFTSWVPLVSRMCPSDTYRVYKSGSNVRIDTTLIGFDQTSWQRGNRSYIFKGQADGATMMEVDHETGQVYMENMRTLPPEQAQAYMRPHPGMLSQRLTTPIAITYIDTEKISFERDKAGIWGWRSDRSENVNGHDCKVFSATNVELVTKTRTEHLTDADKEKSSPRSPIQSFLNIAEVEEKQNSPSSSEESESCSLNNPTNITAEEYFNPEVDLQGRDIGRPKEVAKKVQSFKAHLWLAEEYPLKLQDQVMPIVDLMAISSSHFAKLKHFIQMQLPNGFPVKIEIPLFHVLTARITFGNIFGVDAPINKVSTVTEEDRLSCVIEEDAFDPPSSYTVIGHSDQQHLQMSLDEDDALLQYAIQQSLVEAGTEQDQVDIWEALQADHRPPPGRQGPNSKPGSRPNTPAHLGLQTVEDTQLQRAIEESLALNTRGGVLQLSSQPTTFGQLHREPEGDIEVPGGLAVTPGGSILDSEMAMALSLSQQQQEEEEARQKQEEETLKRILELSLTEK